MPHTPLFLTFGGQEMLFLALAVLLLFGGKKIPELMRGLGRGIREFNDARSSIKDEIEQGMKDKEGASKSEQKSA
jgi:sec-independent protein translocase protein TatA